MDNEVEVIEKIVDEVLEEKNIGALAYIKTHKSELIIAVWVILFIIIGIGFSLLKPAKEKVDLATLNWTIDETKIEELKSTLIDGVTLEEIYSESGYTNWRYATDGDDEFVKVETEEDVDVYNVTDGELEETVELEDLKDTFIGKEGMYFGEMAKLMFAFEEELNVSVDVEILISDESDEQLNDDMDYNESEEEVMVNAPNGFNQDTIEIMSALCTALSDQVYIYIEDDLLEDGLIEDDLLEDDLLEDDLLEDDPLEDYDFSYTGDYEVTIVNYGAEEVKFHLILAVEGEEKETIIQDGIAYRDGDLSSYSDEEFRIILFQEISENEIIVTGFDNDMNMVIRVLVER